MCIYHLKLSKIQLYQAIISLKGKGMFNYLFILFLTEGLKALIYLAEPLSQLLLFLYYSEALQKLILGPLKRKYNLFWTSC